MHTNFTVDLSQPSAERELAATSDRDEYFHNGDTVGLDRALDFGASSTCDQLFDFGLSELENCYPNPTTSQDPMLTPPPSMLNHTASPTNSNKHPEVIPGISQSPTEPRSSRSGRQKADRARKTKGSERPHYAVEKRYRSTLNEKYAALARILSSEAIQRICRTEAQDWAVEMDDAPSGSKGGSKDERSRQGKTATLSRTIENINVLSRCCRREAEGLEQLRCGIYDVRNRVQHILRAKIPPSREQHDGEWLRGKAK
ncbi:uncharacterized protein BP5553_05696 [Venustampulla echinocandica]|uniref:Uncharacterized protein n=1 Tax=Venustampulla echinocandica TaxID=2656787 RepID=A0A370TLD7_9HELO|nr:uncharacterized protein BP5553_05696 [Venustampulla echinocandica]RDL36344.1 hypothetical protein BP5553_05696 [Venustampulla echinocandica]